MASAIASTSSCVFPPLLTSTSAFFPASPPPKHRVFDPDDVSELEDDKPFPTSIVLDSDDAALPREKSGGRVKKFMCTWPGCGKCYTRPTRLEEHQRVHTGERPFACSECPSTFARNSHLKAHLRTHSSDSEKKYACGEDGCDKKFWTNQHLKKHVEVAHRGKTYDCTACSLTFRKHHLLRTHVAEVHSPPGTNPFICEHPGCDRSFKQNVHLKAHMKTHDPSRYVCLHPDCAPLPLSSRQFSTWSSLQSHTKSTHPPKCPYPECDGKTFTTRRGLRVHLVIHEGDVGDGADLSGDGAESKQTRRKKRSRGSRRRRVKKSDSDEETAQETEQEIVEVEEEEEGSDWEERQESERDERMREDFRRGGKKKRRIYEESAGLTQGLPATLPLPALLVGSFGHNPLPAAPSPSITQQQQQPTSSFYLDLITGANYSAASTSKSTGSSSLEGKKKLPVRKYPCPFPAILGLPFTNLGSAQRSHSHSPDDDEGEGEGEEDPARDGSDDGTCAYWFSRVYDVERHLRSRHGIEMHGGRDTLQKWYEVELEDGYEV
ncbi:hypothetical protein JCM5296_003418 [Sporobolomyces johnsonii]